MARRAAAEVVTVRTLAGLVGLLLPVPALAAGCTEAEPGRVVAPLHEDGGVDLGGRRDAGTRPRSDGGGALLGDAGATEGDLLPSEDRFATRVVSFTPGGCAGFGSADMPDIVLGPPRGRGRSEGSLDVVSLGRGGEIILSFEPNAVVDGPGPDLLVFENAFHAAGTGDVYADPGEVSVSDDGVTWTTFPCTAAPPDYGQCAGWHPVFATDGRTALDPAEAGGDPYDLATIGVTRARFVRIVDRANERCNSAAGNQNGFDLDAIAALHAAHP